MEDVELILRFFAYRQIENISSSTVSEILDTYLEKANECFDENILNNLEDLFNRTINLAYTIFESNTFKFKSRDKNKEITNWSKPSKMIYDPIMLILSNFYQDINLQKKLIENKLIIQERFEKIMDTEANEFSGRNNNKSDVLRRVNLFKEIFDL